MNSKNSPTKEMSTAQYGPVSGDIHLALCGLSQIIHRLPEDRLQEGLQLINALFEAADRVASLESSLVCPEHEAEAPHVQ